MRQLTKLQGALFLIGGLLMVIGAGSFALLWQQKVMCWVYLVGAVLFTVMQSMQIYEGQDFTIKRLKSIMGLADMFFILAGILMIDLHYHILETLFGGNYFAYIEMVYNKWVVLLLIAALLEIYTTHRIDHEHKKKKKR